jgi:thiopeptide-type bacteriocin biosynthesis protein
MADLVRRLREVQAGLDHHNRAASQQARRSIRRAVAGQMTSAHAWSAQPVAVDLRLDCHLVLPQQVAREAEAAASALARLTAHPSGTPAWQSYHTRFFERYGIGALVPVLDVVDADVGLGFPAGYAGSTAPEPPGSLSARDERLLALAQTAALDGHDEIVLDERLIAELAPGDPERVHLAPHSELCFEIRSSSAAALGRSEFELAVTGVSRGAGTIAGRFISVLDQPEQRRILRTLTRLPVSDPDALPVQLSFPPLVPGTADVARSPELLPRVISLAEHRDPSDAVIGLDDLAVGCDGHRLYLASLTQERRLEPAILHALDLRAHTPPLARFLAEVARAQTAVLTAFEWGAARSQPFLPRVRYRCTVLSPARWLLDRAELPERGTPWSEWEAAVAGWRVRRRLPQFVHLVEGDRRLRLDLTQPGHLALLRAHLDSVPRASLTEAAGPEAHGWFGGRSHEISLPMMANRCARWPAVRPVSAAPVVRRDHGHLPGASRWLYAKLYGHRERQAEILAEHLPELLSAWDESPLWWFIRYRDPEWHLRLRIALLDTKEFGSAAHRLSAWACGLRRRGLLSDVQFATYRPEVGRWGEGTTMAAAEEVFAADSRALAAQFGESSRPHDQILCAANFVAIAAGFTGSAGAGTRWLIEHAKPEARSPHPGPGVAEAAVGLANPGDDWAALREAPGGRTITGAWAARSRTLADYRARLAATDGTDPDAVLVSLLHAHHIRAVGIDREDERTCLHLARSAALGWNARAAGSGA